MTPTLLVVVLSSLATIVVSVIEILALAFGADGIRTGWTTRACLTKEVAAYIVVSMMWNAAGSLLALYALRTIYPPFSEWLGPMIYLLAVVLGVLVLGFVLSNSEITMFNRAVLAYVNWVGLLRPPAVRSVQSRHSQFKSDLQQDLQSAINFRVPPQELQTHLLNCLGQEQMTRLHGDAVRAGADPMLYKVMQLVEHYPEEARSLARRRPTRRK